MDEATRSPTVVLDLKSDLPTTCLTATVQTKTFTVSFLEPLQSYTGDFGAPFGTYL